MIRDFFINRVVPRKPLENHKTAAWANIEHAKKIANVADPAGEQVINAKEYADENEK